MTEDEDSDYYSYKNEDISKDAYIILSQGSWRSTPDMQPGLTAEGCMLYDKSANTLTTLPSGEPGKVTVNYKTENGDILKSIYRVGVVGRPYKTYPADVQQNGSTFNGYTLKTTPANAEGTFAATAENLQVDYIYSSGDTPPARDISITGFTANPSSSVNKGSSVNLAAAATGGTGTLQYKFTAQLENGGEGTIQDYGTANTATWTPQVAGRYTLKVYVRDAGNKSGEKTITNYEVKDNTPTDIQISFTNGAAGYVYDGTEKRPAVTVKDGTKTLVENTDYNLSYDNNVNAGDKDSQNAPKVTIVGRGDYAAKIASTVLTFTIDKAEKPQGAPESAMTVNAGLVSAITLSAGWEWSDSSRNYQLGAGETFQATAVYNGTDKENYKTTTVSVSLRGISCNHVGTDRETIITQRPTCTEAGRKDVTCAACHTRISAGEEIPALGHTGGTATCTSKATCAICEQKYGQINSGNHLNTVVENKVDANCQHEGYTGDTRCRDCNSLISKGTSVQKTGHFEDAGSVTKAPTATANGVKTYTCIVCGQVTRTEVIPKTGSTTEQGGTTESDAPLKAGDSVIDSSSKAVYKVTQSTSAAKQVAFVLSSGSAKTVTIPDKVVLKGTTYQVTSVADSAFKNNKTIQTVKMGSNIKTIGDSAFSGCSKLKKVTLSNNTTTIESKAFYKCTNLTSITIPAKISRIGSKAFYGCKKLKKITIKTTKLTSKKVGSQAFKGIASKATIKVPKKKLKAYKKLLKAKGVGSKVKIKK